MAFVDLETEKIFGAEENTPTWFHEKGHIVFNKSNFGNNFAFWKENIFVLLIVSLGFGSLINNFYIKSFSFSLTLIFVIMYFFEEIWCWVYSFKTIRGDKYGYEKNNSDNCE